MAGERKRSQQRQTSATGSRECDGRSTTTRRAACGRLAQSEPCPTPHASPPPLVSILLASSPHHHPRFLDRSDHTALPPLSPPLSLSLGLPREWPRTTADPRPSSPRSMRTNTHSHNRGDSSNSRRTNRNNHRVRQHTATTHNARWLSDTPLPSARWAVPHSAAVCVCVCFAFQLSWLSTRPSAACSAPPPPR